MSLIVTLGVWTGKGHQIWKYMTDVERAYLLRNESGSQTKMRTIGNGIFIKKTSNQENNRETFIADSGATSHMVKLEENMKNLNDSET